MAKFTIGCVDSAQRYIWHIGSIGVNPVGKKLKLSTEQIVTVTSVKGNRMRVREELDPAPLPGTDTFEFIE